LRERQYRKQQIKIEEAQKAFSDLNKKMCQVIKDHDATQHKNEEL
jgi:hypothetical protein